MIIEILFKEETITLFVIPLLIFLLRVIDVSLGTIRLIFVSKGQKLFSSILGFFEVLIWLVAITRIMDNLTNFYAYLAYALGFSTGTFVGIYLEEKISIGKVFVRITTNKDSIDLVNELKKKRYTYTSIGVDGPDGLVKSIHVIIDKKNLNKLINFVNNYDSKAYYTVEEVKIVREKQLINSDSDNNPSAFKKK